MIGPTLHLGGTSYDELMRLYTDAIEAVRMATGKVIDACPHGRDYIIRDYITGHDAYKADMVRHSYRLTLLNDVCMQLEAVRDSIQKQQDEREAQKR